MRENQGQELVQIQETDHTQEVILDLAQDQKIKVDLGTESGTIHVPNRLQNPEQNQDQNLEIKVTQN